MRPDATHMRVFGSPVFAIQPAKSKRDAIGSVASIGVFVGYDESTAGGYKVYGPVTKHVCVRRDVCFLERWWTMSLVVRSSGTFTLHCRQPGSPRQFQCTCRAHTGGCLLLKRRPRDRTLPEPRKLDRSAKKILM